MKPKTYRYILSFFILENYDRVNDKKIFYFRLKSAGISPQTFVSHFSN